MKTEFAGELNFPGDFWDTYTFKVSLNEEDLAFINKAREFIASVPDTYEVTTFFYGLEAFGENETESARLEYSILEVTKDRLSIKGMLKHDSVEFSADLE